MYNIILIRHAATDANIEGKYCGVTESHVVWDLETIYSRLIPKLPDLSSATVHVSPRARARETASAIIPKEQYTVDPALAEIDFGLFEGYTYPEILAKYPDEASKWMLAGEEFQFPEGESIVSFYQRVVSGFESILSHAKEGDHIVLVTHAGVIQAILSHVLSGSHKLFWRFRIDHCSVSKLSICSDSIVVDCINQ